MTTNDLAMPSIGTGDEPGFTIGVEEEYLLVDPVSRDLASDPPAELLRTCEERLPGHVSPEFLRCQVEVGTPVCRTIAEAREKLADLRRTVSDIAAQYDLKIIASGTHPFGAWMPQKTTDRSRYEQLRGDIGVPARRLLICASHVHVGIEDANLRIDLMNQVRYFLPHLLALSSSSPFWQGEPTGLKSYRLAVFNELPRTGIPEAYASYGEFEQHLSALVDVGVIEDGTKLWWDVRPSARFPTLEMRICDIPTRLDDCITIASLYLCLLRMLWRLKRSNVAWRRYNTLLINENRWRAMRYGMDAGLIDFGRRSMVEYPELLEEIVALTAEDAEFFDCQAEIDNAHDIARRRPSADRQLAIYHKKLEDGATPRQALDAVVDWLIEETMLGL